MNAFMITMGNNVSGPFDNTFGAGLFTLPTNTTWFAYKTTATAGSVVDIPIALSGTVSQIDAALWWPETSARHNDVDLALVNPSGSEVAWSSSSASIFEKLRLSTTTTGTWKIRVRSFSVVGSQTVYAVAFQRF